jgi:single-stranded-DNA-specific exonuclease
LSGGDVVKWKQKLPKIEYSPFDDLKDQLAAINGIENLNEFLNPSWEHISNPCLLKNIKEGTRRIIKAIHSGEKIVVMADIDSDGINSAAIMVNYLEKHSANVSYIYAQRKDGHGLHTTVDKIPEDTRLLIIVDSSSSEWKECRQLKEKGIDVLIIDHHPLDNPNYYCILINPQQEGCDYPNKNISGSGLTWQVCRVLDNKLDSTYALELVDMAAIGLISDMMCMNTMENRAIVNIGLSNVKNIGLNAILSAQGLLKKKLSTTDIGYKVSTLINASARLNKIELALELLTTDTTVRADELVKEINKLNKQRKTKQTVHVDDLLAKVDSTQKIIIHLDHNKEISKAFSGLIANEIANTYQRPCLILSPDESQGNTYSGSYRSYSGFNLKTFFSNLSLVETTGGHEGAGGISVKNENLFDFIDMVKENSESLSFESEVEYDLELSCDEIDEKLIYVITDFYRISGANFPMGKFLVSDILVDEVKVKGKNEDTVEAINQNLSLMKFKTSRKFAESIPLLTNISAVGTLSVNGFYNFGIKKYVKTNQIILDDFKVVS